MPGQSSPSRWRKLIEPDMLAALSAVVIGACALVVSVVQVRIMRQQQYAAVWPRIQIGQSHSTGRHVAMTLANAGTGPAAIRDMLVEVDNRAVTTWTEVFQTMVPTQQPQNLVLMQVAGRIMRAGEVIHPFSASDPVFADAYAAASTRIRVRVCYCSVYDQCWWVADSFNDVGPVPEQVDRCERGAGSFRD